MESEQQRQDRLADINRRQTNAEEAENREEAKEADPRPQHGQGVGSHPHRATTQERVDHIFLETVNRLKAMGLQGQELSQVTTRLNEAATIAKSVAHTMTLPEKEYQREKVG